MVRMKRIMIVGSVIMLQVIFIGAGFIGGEIRNSEKGGLLKEVNVLESQTEEKTRFEGYEHDEDVGEKVVMREENTAMELTGEKMDYGYQEGVMGRIYFSDTGETAKILTGETKEDLIDWCEKMVALDPEYLSYEIL